MRPFWPVLAAYLTALFLWLIPLDAAANERPGSGTMSLEGGHWFDGENFVEAQWYVVDGRFTSQRPDRVDATVHLDGKFILPPLAEAHNHDAQNIWTVSRSIDKYLDAGVFYSGQMCANPAAVAGFRDLLNRPTTPDFLFTGACITSSDGHPLGLVMQDQPEADPASLRAGWTVVDSRADIDRVWPAIAEARPDLIKLILVNSEKYEENRANPALFGFNGMNPALVAPIVERAHRDGMRVVVHTDSAADFAVAVAADADIIGHLPGYRFARGMEARDYRLSEASVAEAAARGTMVITTAGVARYYLQARPDDREALQSHQADNLRRLREAGVALAIGSDQFAATVIDELVYLDALGVIPRAELLRLAASATPRMLFPDRKIGAFEEGMEASLIAYDDNPLENLETLRRPAVRIKQGNLLGAHRRP